ncbi:MAG TPA: hypothetical protein VF150_10380 [Thermoanaerobaculia bacterium]
MARRFALAFLAAASPAVLLASFAGGPAAAWTFALLTAAFPVALMALGAASPRRPLGRAAWALAALLLLAEGTAAGVLLLGGNGTGASLAGFPLATVVLVAGVWLLPLPLATLAYAWCFDETGITSEHLAVLRERAGGPEADRRRG